MSGKPTADTARRQLDAAVSRHRAGDIQEAARLYGEVLAAEPLNAEALQLLGVLSGEAGLVRQGMTLMRQAEAIQPAIAWFHGNRAALARQLGETKAARAGTLRALALDRDSAETHLVAGNLALDVNDHVAGAAAFQHGIALKPAYDDAWNNLGDLWSRLDQPAQASRLFRRALAANARHAEALNNLGNAVYAEGRAAEALPWLRKAAALRPGVGETLVGMGVALRGLAAFDAARASYGRALTLAPNSAEARYNLSLIQLMEGDYEQGWPGFALRRQVRAFRPIRPEPEVPLWQGEALDGRAILLHAEQGHGDAIQFARYAPAVAAKGGRVILECHPALHRLFKSLAGVTWLTSRGEEPPAHALHCPLMSLGRLFGIIPAAAPYLAPPGDAIEAWRARVAKLQRPRVGLCWRGSRSFSEDRTRSPGLAALEPILAAKAGFVALMPDPEPDPRIRDVSNHLADFAETAAAIQALDLVITSDTAVAHLAGALGRPAWVMLQHVPDWRWLLERPDSPWYPSLTLYRQTRPGDWHELAERIARDLARLSIA